MPLLRSSKKYDFVADKLTARRHPPRIPQERTDRDVLAARNRNIHYLKQARKYEADTGDSPDTLRKKRRWLQEEFKAHRNLGKPVRELHDLYNKRNITKPRNRRPKFDDLSDAAKELNRRLEDALARERRSGAHAGDEVSGAVSGNAGEISSVRAVLLT